jgi:putative membrane protein
MATITTGIIVMFFTMSPAKFSGIDVSESSVPLMTAHLTSTAEDKDFVMKAAEAGLLEIKAAQLALKTSSNAEIKSFAEGMINDHGKANAELQAIAKTKAMTPRSTLSSTSEQKLKALSKKQGVEFDKAYAQAMVRDHQEAVELFKTESNSGKDAELKQWAAEKLPTLEHHLSMARELTNSIQ